MDDEDNAAGVHPGVADREHEFPAQGTSSAASAGLGAGIR
jgi:hypothetical protein